MTDTTCKRTACDVVSPVIAGYPTFCSDECELIHNVTFKEEPPADFSWLGPSTKPRTGESSGGWPS